LGRKGWVGGFHKLKLLCSWACGRTGREKNQGGGTHAEEGRSCSKQKKCATTVPKTSKGRARFRGSQKANKPKGGQKQQTRAGKVSPDPPRPMRKSRKRGKPRPFHIFFCEPQGVDGGLAGKQLGEARREPGGRPRNTFPPRNRVPESRNGRRGEKKKGFRPPPSEEIFLPVTWNGDGVSGGTENLPG